MYELLAMATMLIDHVGVVFFPHSLILRMIGRIALPLYVYNVVQGTKYTRNYNLYILRMFFLACVSQFFYQQLFSVTSPNIIFTLLIASLIIKLKDRWRSEPVAYYCVLLVTGIIVHYLSFDTGFITILLADVYASKRFVLLKHTLVILFTFVFDSRLITSIFFFQLPASILVLTQQNVRLNGSLRSFYQGFYPLHLAVLLAVRNLLSFS